MTTQAEFFQAHAVDGVLTDAQMGQMLNLPEGDSGAQPQSGTPDPTPAPTPAPVATPEPTPAPTPEPVILAKDGVHTIAYEKLVEAREGEKAAKAQAETAAAEVERLRLENEALKRAPQPTPAPTTAPVAEADLGDFGDFSDEAIKKGIKDLVNARVAVAKAEMDAQVDAKVAEKLAPLERRHAEDAVATHWKTLYTAHPNMDAMLESQELKAWRESQPSFAQAAIDAVLEQGTTAQVVELFDTFVKATGKTTTTPPATAQAETPEAKAAAAVAKAQERPATSLSEIPGSGANHDEAAAMLEMNPMAQLRKFDGKTPEQIHALMSKVL